VRYGTNIARVAHGPELDALISPVLGAIGCEAAIVRLTAAGIACGRLSTLEDLHAHPQARHIVVDSPTGPIEMMGRGVRFDEGAASFGAVPNLGEHSQVLRREFAIVQAGAGA
jgi:crotonobetainyl-CoA:carnitine CoA-transferase CaiB-like acyl-CoA transferase